MCLQLFIWPHRFSSSFVVNFATIPWILLSSSISITLATTAGYSGWATTSALTVSVSHCWVARTGIPFARFEQKNGHLLVSELSMELPLHPRLSLAPLLNANGFHFHLIITREREQPWKQLWFEGPHLIAEEIYNDTNFKSIDRFSQISNRQRTWKRRGRKEEERERARALASLPWLKPNGCTISTSSSKICKQSQSNFSSQQVEW